MQVNTNKKTPKKQIIISPKQDFWIDFNELWQYNGIFWALWYREIRLRYFQSILGWVWAIFQPLGNVFVMYLVFGLGFNTPTQGVFYPVWVGIGMIYWLFFAQTCQQCASVMIQSRHFTQKIYFPHIWLPLSKIGVLSIDFLIQTLVWWVICMCFFTKYSIFLLFFPVILGWFWVFVVCFGVLLANFGNAYKDALPLVQMGLQIGFFVTPVAYSIGIIPQKWHFVYYFNPLVTMLDLTRACFFGEMVWKTEFICSFLVSFLVILNACRGVGRT